MKYLSTLFIIIALLFAQTTMACSCASQGDFLKVSPTSSLVALIKVKKFSKYNGELPLSMEVEIIDIYKGHETKKTVTVWGDNGMLCRPYLREFEVEKYYVIAFSTGYDGAKVPAHLDEKSTDYIISICGEYWLNADLKNQVATSSIAGMKTKINLADLKQKMLSLAAQENSGSLLASTFINSLNSQQKAKTLFTFDDNTRYNWHYFPASSQHRNGIPINEMNADQKEKLNALLQKFLSKEGYNRTKSIMDLEYILQELQPYNPNRIPENYLVAFYGTPGRNSEWGWKFSGHHVALNFTVINDNIAFAPFFFGSNPAIVQHGPKKGFRAIKEEEDLALELVNSLTTQQKEKAIFQTRAFSDIVTGTSKQVTPLKPVGILVSEMSAVQYELLKKLIRSYLSSMPSPIAEMRMKKIAKEDMNSIRFAWAGETEINKPHYYRVQGKTFLIEFDNVENNGNHIHLVWRDFNGDFGIDLLKEHYKNSKHHQK